MQLNVLACNCKGQILAYFLLFLCFYNYSSYFISIFQVSILFQYKYFPLSDEKHYSVSSKKDMNKFLFTILYRYQKKAERYRIRDHIHHFLRKLN